MKPAIEFNGFSYAYRQDKLALNNIQVSIPKGSFTVITGPSGAGKTTLCLAIAGAVPQYFGGSVAGNVQVNQTDTRNISMHDLALHVGSVLQDYESQLVAMTVEEEIAFGLENMGMAEHDIQERVRRVLQRVGLEGLEQREVSSLSGGQKQRLAIAGVLVLEPEIIVLDEPTSALDPQGAVQIYELLHTLNSQGVTVVVVEHDLSQVLSYAQQVLVIHEGKLLYCGTLSEVLPCMIDYPELQTAMPILWQVKLQLEEALERKFADWRSVEDAKQDIVRFIMQNKGVCRSA